MRRKAALRNHTVKCRFTLPIYWQVGWGPGRNCVISKCCINVLHWFYSSQTHHNNCMNVSSIALKHPTTIAGTFVQLSNTPQELQERSFSSQTRHRNCRNVSYNIMNNLNECWFYSSQARHINLNERWFYSSQTRHTNLNERWFYIALKHVTAT